jgi:hypothetical protein
MSNAALLTSLETTESEATFAGAERRLDDMSNVSSLLSMRGEIVGNHPTMGTCGCPMPPAPNSPPSPCGC